MVWKAVYYLIKKDNYLKASTLLICICSISAVALNIEGSNCIRQVNSLTILENNIVQEIQDNQRNNTGFSNQFQQQVEERRQQQLEEENRQAQEAALQDSYELRKYCFLVTNMYVYSLFGVIIGFILLAIWYGRYKQIWTWRKNN
ncbi:hypothetical protein [Candidatus Nitrosocosmicus franklandus]|uniref:Uncharacterized protein n=1 Tax=Candidatus Nitrosocosmicus franklandianus TaxID=1798806 RepID=A0A484I6Y8_9ARCH|nr:hypothetical protein [Candidatus Nitrosocosmicus franklandus]VFJ12876.1 conserved protein of unknown function [Candidatus Nitrosocosmicus franklandus]